MRYLLTKLDKETASALLTSPAAALLSLTSISDSVDENSEPLAIALKYARNPERALTFNYASMAHNQQFFFETLVISPSSLELQGRGRLKSIIAQSPSPRPMPDVISSYIKKSFSSVSSFRETFLATANAMFGPGFVWLVYLRDTSRFAILNTYIAGSPYPGAHFRRQGVDMNTANTGVWPGETPLAWRDRMGGKTAALGHFADGKAPENGADPTSPVGFMGMKGKNVKLIAPGGQDLEVLLAVSTWEHMWMMDWGIGGKMGYLNAWWERIDWETVLRRFTARQFSSYRLNSRG